MEVLEMLSGRFGAFEAIAYSGRAHYRLGDEVCCNPDLQLSSALIPYRVRSN